MITNEQVAALQLDDVVHWLQPQPDPPADPVPCDQYVVFAKAGSAALLTCAAKAHSIRLPNAGIAEQLHLPADCPLAPPP